VWQYCVPCNATLRNKVGALAITAADLDLGSTLVFSSELAARRQDTFCLSGQYTRSGGGVTPSPDPRILGTDGGVRGARFLLRPDSSPASTRNAFVTSTRHSTMTRCARSLLLVAAKLPTVSQTSLISPLRGATRSLLLVSATLLPCR